MLGRVPASFVVAVVLWGMRTVGAVPWIAAATAAVRRCVCLRMIAALGAFSSLSLSLEVLYILRRHCWSMDDLEQPG